MESQNVYGITEPNTMSGMAKRAGEYMKSNNIVESMMFILIILVIAIFLFNYIVSLFIYFLSPNASPYLINGMVDTKKSDYIILQDPEKNNSKTIIQSSEEPSGLEFTWSFWMYIDDLDYRRGELKNVFVKGDDLYDNISEENSNTENHIMNSPGVYLTPFDNKLLFVFNTFDTVMETFEVDNVPLNKWINVVIRCESKTIDVFVNSSFSRRYVLSSLPRQNYNNVHIGKHGGFAGFVSDLRYFNYAIGTRELNNTYRKGPNTKLLNDSSEEAMKQAAKTSKSSTVSFKPDFLSFRWMHQ